MEEQLTLFTRSSNSNKQSFVVNVASVPQRSPFRYPGGKTWLVPQIRKWLGQEKKVGLLIEPFGGGGIVSLTAAFEKLADEIIMGELDEEVASVWQVILKDDNEWLADRILSFELTHENVTKELSRKNKEIREIAFCTVLKNRVFHGGIIAKGSGMLKQGENGKGIASRWYAKTLSERIRAINLIKHKIKFYQKDAFELIKENINRSDAYFFIDPPYTLAGRRLYTHFQIDNEKLFYLSSKIKGRFMLTYDDTEEIRKLAAKYSLDSKRIPMKTTHHLEKYEIVISDNFDWWGNN